MDICGGTVCDETMMLLMEYRRAIGMQYVESDSVAIFTRAGFESGRFPEGKQISAV